MNRYSELVRVLAKRNREVSFVVRQRSADGVWVLIIGVQDSTQPKGRRHWIHQTEIPEGRSHRDAAVVEAAIRMAPKDYIGYLSDGSKT